MRFCMYMWLHMYMHSCMYMWLCMYMWPCMYMLWDMCLRLNPEVTDLRPVGSRALVNPHRHGCAAFTIDQ